MSGEQSLLSGSVRPGVRLSDGVMHVWHRKLGVFAKLHIAVIHNALRCSATEH